LRANKIPREHPARVLLLIERHYGYDREIWHRALSQNQILKSDFGGGHDGGRRGHPMVEIGEDFKKS